MPAVLRMRHPNPGSRKGQGGNSAEDVSAADVIDEPCLEQHAGKAFAAAVRSWASGEPSCGGSSGHWHSPPCCPGKAERHVERGLEEFHD